MKELFSLTIAEASELLEKGEITSVELTKSILARIGEVDKKIGAYLFVNKEGALKSAGKSDERRKAGKALGKLDGIPIALKDLFCQKGVETTAASNILKGFVPCYDSTAVKKLKDAGAVILGKLNQDAFAHGSSTENSDFKVTKNPWDLERVPGGSSGGSAAAVAADLCLGALGTDTGGSIRQPASLCGVVGLKPTYDCQNNRRRGDNYGSNRRQRPSRRDDIKPAGSGIFEVTCKGYKRLKNRCSRRVFC
jgi:aspartyl-tRNA(Asn)/glutamyl-tRNA(Gln) amidotransferase subunit A